MMRRICELALLASCLLFLTAPVWALGPDPEELPPAGTFPPKDALLQLEPITLHTPDTIGEALDLADAESVALGGNGGKVVIADKNDTDGNFFYIEEDDRSSGVRVNYTGATVVHRGDRVALSGAMGNVGAHERCVNATSVSVVSHDFFLPRPLGMDNRALGGDKLNDFTPGVSGTTYAPTGLLAPYNKGLLVRTWGRVTSTTTGYFLLSDIGAVNYSVRVAWTGGTMPDVGACLVVTGVSSSYRPSSNTPVVRLLRVRDAADMVTPSTEDLSSPDYVLPSIGQDGWDLVGLPGVPYIGVIQAATYDSTPGSVFASAVQHLVGGTLYGNLWKWNPAMPQDVSYSLVKYTGSWLPNTPNTVYSASEGYWLKYATGGEIAYPALGAPVPQTDRYLVLSPVGGWNLIGYPFTASQDLAHTYVADGYRMLTMRQASQYDQDWVQSTGFWWNAGNQSQYDVGLAEEWPWSTTMQPWRAYWFASHKRCALVIAPPAPSLEMIGPDTLGICDESVQIRARLIHHGAPVAAHDVTFDTTSGVFTTNAQAIATVQTDTAGIATVSLTRATGQLYGSADVTASATVDGSAASCGPLHVTIKGWQMTLTLNPSSTVGHDVPISVTARLATDDSTPVANQSVTLNTSHGSFAGGTPFTDDTDQDGTISTTLTVSDHPVTVTVTASAVPCTPNRTATDSKQLSVVCQAVRVKTNGDDQNDGLTWTNAKATVQAGVNAAVSSPCREVWVAAGTYPPTSTINLASGVKLYGGFDGTEAATEERDWSANVTILDGTNAAGSLVTCDSAGVGTVIDGFTIRNGAGSGIHCTDSSPAIRHNTIRANSGSQGGEGGAFGGGIYCTGGSPVITNNWITDNRVYIGIGGGIYCKSCQSVEIANNVIAHNRASLGPGLYLESVSGIIVNNTVVRNVVGYGGLYCDSSPSATIANNIVAFNTAVGMCVTGDSPTQSHNCVYGNGLYDYTGDPGTGDISADPKLVPDNAHIQPDSPCRNAGDNSAVQSAWKDIDGGDRILGGTVDIGADESPGCTWYVVTATMSPAYPGAGGNATVTAHVYDPVQAAVVSNCQVNFSVDRGQLTSIHNNDSGTGTIDAPGNTTGHGNTGVNGEVYADVTVGSTGVIIVTASVGESCGGSLSAKVSNIRLVFCLDVSESMYLYLIAIPHVRDTISYLSDRGVPVTLGAVTFDDYIIDTCSLTTDTDAFIGWVEGAGTPGGQLGHYEESFGALMTAKDIAPGGFIALATDITSTTSTYTESEVVTGLTNAACRVYIDAYSYTSSFANVAVNGSLENSTGTYTFPLLRSVIAP